MGFTAKLPDVNAALVRWRSQAIESAKNKDYNMAITSIGALNALLPGGEMEDGSDSFKVEVNTFKYYSMKADRQTINCKNCEEECILSDLKQYDLELGWQEQILVHKETQRVWVCSKCGKPNEMNINDIRIEKFQEPYFFRCMPSPPVQKRGIVGRNTYDSEFAVWYDIASREIESQIARYRAEYIAQNDDEEEFNLENFKD